MNEPQNERRLAANEVIFRRYNEKVSGAFEELQVMAKEHDQDPSYYADDSPLQFYCECSDESCRKRISMRPSRYREIHKNRRRFIIVPGHEVLSIERAVEEDENCVVIEKYNAPPLAATKLNTTDVINT